MNPENVTVAARGGEVVREMVAACGVTKPLLSYYFGGKKGLFLEVMGYTRELLEATIAGA